MERGYKTVGLLLGVLFLLGVTATAVGPAVAADPEGGGAISSPDSMAGPEREIVLYYFHGTRRCRTCLSIEAYATEAIEGEFGEQLEDGTLVWKLVNYEKKANRHFVEEFGLVSSSLVVVEAGGDAVGRYEVLQDAWTLVRKKAQFIEYVQNSVRAFLD